MGLTSVRLFLIVISYVFSYIFFARYFGNVYAYFFPEAISSSIVPSTIGAWMVGIPLSTIFLLTLLIHASGKKHAWAWIIIPLLPAILFQIAFDILHLYVPLLLGVFAWWLGTVANKALWKLAPGFMARLQ